MSDKWLGYGVIAIAAFFILRELKGTFGGIGEAFGNVTGGIGEAFTSFAGGVGDVFSGIGGAFQSVTTGIGEFAGQALGYAGQAGMSILETGGDLLTTAAETGQDVIETGGDLLTTTAETGQDIIGTGMNIFQDLTGLFTDIGYGAADLLTLGGASRSRRQRLRQRRQQNIVSEPVSGWEQTPDLRADPFHVGTQQGGGIGGR